MSTQGKVVAFEKTPDFLRECAARYAQSEPLRALDFLHRALELAPEDAQTLFQEAALLGEMGCALESLLVLSRAAGGNGLPGDACYTLLGSLASLGLSSSVKQALKLCLSAAPQDEDVGDAARLLALTELHRQAQTRRMRRAMYLSEQAVRLIRTGHCERARRLVERALGCAPDNRSLTILKVKCDLHTGREREALALAEYLARGDFDGDRMTLALVLSEKPGAEALLERLTEGFIGGEEETEERLARFKVWLNQEDGERIRALLPRMLRETPYDRGVLHAAAIDALKYGKGEEDARWYWQCMQRIRPTDAIAAQYLAQADADGPWSMRLSEARSERLRMACRQGGEDALSLARWALEAQESEALGAVLGRLPSGREAEALLRETLAHPAVSGAVKKYALELLMRREARPPYLWIDPEGVRLLPDGVPVGETVPESALRLRDFCREWLRQGGIGDVQALDRLWSGLDQPLLSRGERLAPALLALSLQACGRGEDTAKVAAQFGLSERRIRFDAARLRARLNKNERGEKHT